MSKELKFYKSTDSGGEAFEPSSEESNQRSESLQSDMDNPEAILLPNSGFRVHLQDASSSEEPSEDFGHYLKELLESKATVTTCFPGYRFTDGFTKKDPVPISRAFDNALSELRPPPQLIVARWLQCVKKLIASTSEEHLPKLSLIQARQVLGGSLNHLCALLTMQPHSVTTQKLLSKMGLESNESFQDFDDVKCLVLAKTIDGFINENRLAPKQTKSINYQCEVVSVWIDRVIKIWNDRYSKKQYELLQPSREMEAYRELLDNLFALKAGLSVYMSLATSQDLCFVLGIAEAETFEGLDPHQIRQYTEAIGAFLALI